MVESSPWVVVALMNNESAKPLQTNSDPENPRGNGLEGGVDKTLQVL